QVLHLGNRYQPSKGGAQAETQNGLLIEQGVEDSGCAICASQACRDAVDASLDADVLTENDHATIGGQQLVECGIDRLGEGTRLGLISGLRGSERMNSFGDSGGVARRD